METSKKTQTEARPSDQFRVSGFEMGSVRNAWDTNSYSRPARRVNRDVFSGDGIDAHLRGKGRCFGGHLHDGQTGQ